MYLLRVAISFLTTLPIHAPTSARSEDFGKASVWFSLLGAGLGGLLAALGWGLSFCLPPLIVGTIVTATWALLTGGLHLDGLADCCDGMLSANGGERRLEIMKDPRLGSFGGIGLILVLILKTVLITELVKSGLWLPLILAASLGRWLILPASQQPLARPGGLGDAFAQGVSLKAIFLSSFVPLGVLIFGKGSTLLATGLAIATMVIILTLARRRLGGVTGDVFGMIVELSEVAVLIGMNIKAI